MSDSNSDSDKCKQDSRIPCKYGDKCYQKNPFHQSKYKHPKSSKRKNNPVVNSSPKRVKVDNATRKPPKDVSDTAEGNRKEQESIIKENLSEQKRKECISSSDSEEDEMKIEEAKKEERISSSDSDEDEGKIEAKKGEHISSSDSEKDEGKIEEVKKGEHISSSDSEETNETAEQVSSKEIGVNALQDEDKAVQKDTPPDKLEEKNKSDDNKDAKNTPIPEPKEPFNAKTFIKNRFLVEMPNDFYEFWEFCKQLKPTSPSDALKDAGLKLVGPYDVLAGKFKHTKKPPEEYLLHWRYYYDTPEVFTVIKGDDKTGYHIGYFYDSPQEAPSFLVSNYGTKDGVFTKMGDNIFAAVSLYLEELKKTGDPFKKLHVGKLLSAVKNQAEKQKLNMSGHSKKMKEREFKVVTKTFNKIGIVVPYNKKTELGYRSLAMEDKELMILLTKLEKAAPEQKSKYLSDLQPVLTYASIALDECDFGTGVKLGWELLYHGIDSLNSTISRFLANSYRLLNKEAFAKIAETHMSHRKRGSDLSII